MSTAIKIPPVGESINEVTLASWLKEDGEYVEEGDLLCEIESDKATVELPAESSGVLKIQVEAGSELEIGAVIATLEAGDGSATKSVEVKEQPSEPVNVAPPEVPAAIPVANNNSSGVASPAAKKILAEKGIEANTVNGTGKDGRITKTDAENVAPLKVVKDVPAETQTAPSLSSDRDVKREKMSRMRKSIAKRLVEAKNTTAMLTTFNEVDMYEIMNLRKKYKESFKEKHGVGLGFMSLFTKAACAALKEFPGVNGQIQGDEVVYHQYADVGIAVSTPKGLVVPVVRNAEKLSLASIEKEVIRLATKAREGGLSLNEMEGGTFTITNGGVFGSMLSTPIINLPQSAILGMHNIVQRPWVVDGEVKVRPIMYLALSYDHRIVDGRESVSFLKMVKELIEDPSRLLLEV